MASYAAYRGGPEFGRALRRERITRFIEMAGERPAVLYGPSGLGKTIAASHYADAQRSPVVWVPCGGHAVDREELLACLVAEATSAAAVDDLKTLSFDEVRRLWHRALAEHYPDGVLIVLDDLGDAAQSDSYEFGEAIAASAQHLRVHLVITTRQEAPSGCGLFTIGPRHLCFTRDEAGAVAGLMDRNDLSPSNIERLTVACGGHPALVATLFASSDASDESNSHEAVQLAQRIASAHLDPDECRLFEVMRLLKSSGMAELEDLGFGSPVRAAIAVSDVLPLVRMENGREGQGAFLVVDDLLCLSNLNCMDPGWFEGVRIGPTAIMNQMATGNDRMRLVALMGNPGLRQNTVAWLLEHSDDAVSLLGPANVGRVIGALPLSLVVGHAALMMLSAVAAYETGRTEDAIAAGRVACRLARHDRDLESLGRAGSVLVRSLATNFRAEEALELGKSILRDLEDSGRHALQCDVVAATGVAAAVCLRSEEFDDLLEHARRLAGSDSSCASAYRRLETTRATALALAEGNFLFVADRLLAVSRGDQDDSLSSRMGRRGNAAAALVECGRLRRAGNILDAILGSGCDFADNYYLDVRGMQFIAEGDSAGGIQLMRDALRALASGSNESEIAQNRLMHAIALRSFGQHEDALTESERAYAALSGQDFMGLRSRACIEMAASLLSLRDHDAARGWVESLDSDAFLRSHYNQLRAAMVIAMCDFRDGDVERAVLGLGRCADEIQSESSNWQMAMYIRAFPELLGLLTLAAGAKRLPVHMLRMVLPEHAEASLRSCRNFVPDDEWMLLGSRVLGETEFADYVERKGQPICRVRLFGGLEVIAGERVVQERDWSKRKGRLLFTILVAEQGRDVARDILIDHFWPELPDAKGKNNFYVVWSTMKAALTSPEERGRDCPYIESARGRCRIARDRVRSDVADFDELIGVARRAEAESRPRDAIEAFNDIMALYRGDLLPGDIYDDWFGPLRDRYRREFVEAMLRAVNLLVELNEPGEAVLFARRGLAVDPTREDLYQAALRSHIAAGQRGAAIETFIQCKTQLAEELGLDPSADTVELYRQVLVMEERPQSEFYGLSAEDFEMT